MGQLVSSNFTGRPNVLEDPTFDPLYGFTNGRKEREMIATQAELEACKIPMAHRDYCAHKLIDFYKCRSDNWPLVYKCHHERHDYEHCEHNDYVLRLKEYERERRLMLRQQRKEALSIG